MPLAKPSSGRRQSSRKEQGHGTLGSALLAQDIRFDSSLAQCFGGAPSHAETQDRLAVTERLDNRVVALRARFVLPVAVTFASSVSREGVASKLLTHDPSVFDLENEKM
jgi:hypothetical protein